MDMQHLKNSFCIHVPIYHPHLPHYFSGLHCLLSLDAVVDYHTDDLE